MVQTTRPRLVDHGRGICLGNTNALAQVVVYGVDAAETRFSGAYARHEYARGAANRCIRLRLCCYYFEGIL